MTREEVRAETDRLVDAAVEAGYEAGNDPFEIGLVNQVFRPYVHMLDDAQMLHLDPDGVRACVIAHLANLVKVLMQRTIEKSDVVSAQSIGNEIITKLAQYMTQDLNEWFKAGKPH